MRPVDLPEVDLNIKRHGQHLFSIFGESPADSFTYTLGNAEKDLPELLIIGHFPPQLVSLMLNNLGDVMRERGKAFDEGFVDIGWSYPFKIRKAGERAKKEFTLQAGERVGHQDYEVLQVMICDQNGKYPGDEGCEPDFDVEQP